MSHVYVTNSVSHLYFINSNQSSICHKLNRSSICHELNESSHLRKKFNSQEDAEVSNYAICIFRTPSELSMYNTPSHLYILRTQRVINSTNLEILY